MNIDIIIIFAYLVIINLIGLKFASSKDIKGYFLGGRSVPWVIACFSIVATETSTLTFISIPGVAYARGMGFLQIAFGYLVGRIFVALVLIPKYFEGEFETVYQFIHSKFGISSRKIISIIFHVSRLLGDSARLFVTAIPLTLLTGWSYWTSILIIGIATFIYTYYGGFKSVAIVDSIQLVLYLICAFIGIFLITDILNLSLFSVFERIKPEDFKIISTGLDNNGGLFSSYNIFTGIIGGAFLSFASHGTDHLIVQRVLSCKDEGSARKAMIMSGVIIIFQFFLFLLFGLFIKVLLGNKSFDKNDEILPYFIIHFLPAGVKGLMLAGIFAAAMSTLSSSINSLSSSTSFDILGIAERDIPDAKKVKISRQISLLWTFVIISLSMLFMEVRSSLVEVVLSIASVTYGGMMGIFLLGRFFRDFSDKAAIAGVFISAGVNIFAYVMGVFWLWYVLIGFTVSFLSALIINRVLGNNKQI